MLYHMDTDDFLSVSGVQYPILKAINRGLNREISSTTAPPLPTHPETEEPTPTPKPEPRPPPATAPSPLPPPTASSSFFLTGCILILVVISIVVFAMFLISMKRRS